MGTSSIIVLKYCYLFFIISCLYVSVLSPQPDGKSLGNSNCVGLCILYPQLSTQVAAWHIRHEKCSINICGFEEKPAKWGYVRDFFLSPKLSTTTDVQTPSPLITQHLFLPPLQMAASVTHMFLLHVVLWLIHHWHKMRDWRFPSKPRPRWRCLTGSSWTALIPPSSIYCSISFADN